MLDTAPRSATVGTFRVDALCQHPPDEPRTAYRAGASPCQQGRPTMSDRTPEQNLQAYADVLDAAERLTAAGLATDDPRGITNDGLQTLADLLVVLMVQTGQNHASHTQQVASASARAMMSAVADLYAELSGQPVDGTATQQLLAAATRTARS